MKGKRKKIAVIVIVSVLLVAVVLFILDFVNAFWGNPISKMMAKNAAQKFIDEKYGDLNLQIEKTGYNFKFDHYSVHVLSADSIDTVFSIYVNSWGKVVGDNYEYEVANHFTTYRRYEKELRELGNKLFTEQLDYNISNALFLLGDLPEEEMRNMERDLPFDIQNMPTDIRASVCIVDKEVSYEKASEILNKMVDICDKEKIPISAYSIQLEKEGEEEGPKGNSYMSIYDIPADIIRSEDLSKVLEVLDAE